MALLVIHHRVRDFDAWKPVFDEQEAARKEHGGRRHWLYQSVDDGNDVTVAIEFASREGAEAFVADPSLRQAMERAGVEGEPGIHIREIREQVDY